mgnify:CR=1 FL=1
MKFELCLFYEFRSLHFKGTNISFFIFINLYFSLEFILSLLLFSEYLWLIDICWLIIKHFLWWMVVYFKRIATDSKGFFWFIINCFCTSLLQIIINGSCFNHSKFFYKFFFNLAYWLWFLHNIFKLSIICTRITNLTVFSWLIPID